MSAFPSLLTSRRAAVALPAAALFAVGVLSACSSGSTHAGSGSTASTAGNTVMISAVGGTLVGPNGHTLYENTLDTSSSISCTGACAGIWPPLIGTPSVTGSLDATDFATVTRPDGKGEQVTFDGHPLYYFSGDSGAGQSHGNGIADGGGSWHAASSSVVSTTGGASSPPPPASSSSSGSGYGY